MRSNISASPWSNSVTRCCKHLDNCIPFYLRAHGNQPGNNARSRAQPAATTWCVAAQEPRRSWERIESCGTQRLAWRKQIKRNTFERTVNFSANRWKIHQLEVEGMQKETFLSRNTVLHKHLENWILKVIDERFMNNYRFIGKKCVLFHNGYERAHVAKERKTIPWIGIDFTSAWWKDFACNRQKRPPVQIYRFPWSRKRDRRRFGTPRW